MKPINCMALSKMLLLLVLIVTACQAAPTPNNSRAHMNYGFEHQPGHNYPVLDLTSDTVVKRDKNSVIFKGNAELKRDQSIKFLADYISIEFLQDNRMNYVIEIKGNVSMMTPVALIIKSEKATSLDFRTYIDFAGNVSVSNREQHYKTDWVRYYFLKEELQFKWDDIPTRGYITR